MIYNNKTYKTISKIQISSTIILRMVELVFSGRNKKGDESVHVSVLHEYSSNSAIESNIPRTEMVREEHIIVLNYRSSVKIILKSIIILDLLK